MTTRCVLIARRLSPHAVEERRGPHDGDRHVSGRVGLRVVRLAREHRRRAAGRSVLAFCRRRSHAGAACGRRHSVDRGKFADRIADGVRAGHLFRRRVDAMQPARRTGARLQPHGPAREGARHHRRLPRWRRWNRDSRYLYLSRGGRRCGVHRGRTSADRAPSVPYAGDRVRHGHGGAGIARAFSCAQTRSRWSPRFGSRERPFICWWKRDVLKFAASAALLPEGWAHNVVFTIGDGGILSAIATDADIAGMECAAGPVVPAMPNLHSHAFQRALAGRTGRSSPAHDDSFWTWRQAMYGFLDRVDADALEAIAAQAYVEMAKAGYASVAEFHYVHHDTAGKPYGDPAELAWRVVAAAQTAGLGLTLLPVFYAHAGFGGSPPTAGQKRFVHTTYTFTHLFERLLQGTATHGYVLGVAPHSLRAVTPEEMGHVVRLGGPGSPVHIHAAEQSEGGRRLLRVEPSAPDRVAADPGECRRALVHRARDAHDGKGGRPGSRQAARWRVWRRQPKRTLGDGTFPGHAYLAAGGRFGVGSDSNTIVDPFAELRQLEWSQRMRARRRNVLGAASGGTIGTSLWAGAARGGAQALAQPVGVLEVGRRADLVVLNPADPALAGQTADDVLDAAMFGPSRAPVRDVMAGGNVDRPRRPSCRRSGSLRSLSLRRLRASTRRNDAGGIRPAAGWRTSGHDARRWRSLWRGPGWRDRHRRRPDCLGRAAPPMSHATWRRVARTTAAAAG